MTHKTDDIRHTGALDVAIGLRAVAKWLDNYDKEKGLTDEDDVQKDLRQWANEWEHYQLAQAEADAFLAEIGALRALIDTFGHQELKDGLKLIDKGAKAAENGI